MPTKAERIAQLKVFAHPKRIAIVSYLATLKPSQKSASVTEIFQALNIGQAIASQHLICLKDRGVLKSEQIGTKIYYSIAAPWIVEVVKVLDKQAA